MEQNGGPVRNPNALITHFFQFVLHANSVLKVMVVLKVTKGLVKVSHGYSKVQFVNLDLWKLDGVGPVDNRPSTD